MERGETTEMSVSDNCVEISRGPPRGGSSKEGLHSPLRTCYMGEQAMVGCSLGVPTWLGDDAAVAWHAPGGPPCRPYQWRCLSLRDRAPEQHSDTPSRAISTHARFEPWEAMGEQAMGRCSLGVPTWLADDAALAWHAPGGRPRRPYQWRCLSLRDRAPEQHSDTPSRAISTYAVGGRGRASDGGMLTRGAHVAWRRCGCGMARSWGSPMSPVPVALPFPS